MRKVKLLVGAVAAFAVLALPAGAMARDRDHDKMNDRWEARHGLNIHRNDAAGDPDKDGLKNLGEFRARTNPRDADTDNDGIEDGNETSGTVDSFVEDSANPGTGVLTIKLADAVGVVAGRTVHSVLAVTLPLTVPPPSSAIVSVPVLGLP